MQNLEQSQDAHTVTDHFVTRERAIEIQRCVYKSKIKGIRYKDYENILGIECDAKLFRRHKKKICQSVCINTLANREVLLYFKDFFTDAEMTILLNFAKRPYTLSNSNVTSAKVNKVNKEKLRRIKKIRRQMMYLELYSNGL